MTSATTGEHTPSSRARARAKRFAAAARSLSAPDLVDRLTGIHAMAELADDRADGRLACVDALCALIRTDTGPARDTAIGVIADRLRADPDDGRGWHGHHFDLHGSTFDTVDLSGARLTGTTMDFGGAVFGSHVFLNRATIDGGHVDFDGAVFSGGDLDAGHLSIERGHLGFRNALFAGGDVDFMTARIAGGAVLFEGARFAGGTVRFAGTLLRRGTIDFTGAAFPGGDVDFSGARLRGGALVLDSIRLSGGDLGFVGCRFDGTIVDLSGASIMGDVDAMNARFDRTVDFPGTALGGILDIRGARHHAVSARPGRVTIGPFI
ncbi:pentapeptide repeat-containing protein [Stackebrandtia soli]|uniref:pentapeptide repeat-containing protein n=1 Tax=Stackebrandtia soli TaxID=1892856 RepID=UPI0039E7F334